MEVNVKDKTFWFVFFELFCGFFASVAYLGSGWVGNSGRGTGGGTGGGTGDGGSITIQTFASDGDDHATKNLLINTFLPGGFVPVVFRSQLYTYGKSLGKTLNLVLMIIAAVFYIGGGVIVFLEYDSTELVMVGVFAVAAGVLLIVDLVFLIK